METLNQHLTLKKFDILEAGCDHVEIVSFCCRIGCRCNMRSTETPVEKITR